MWRKSLILIVSIVALYTIAILSGVEIQVGAKGALDFREYWSAWQLMLAGLNPYDAKLMLEAQAGISKPTDAVVMMWNPPWTPVLLSPILSFPFERAAFLWFITQLLCVMAVTILTRVSVSGTKAPLWLCGIIAIAFMPVLDSLLYGQIGCFMALGVALFLFSERKRCFLCSGAVLSLLSVKPHLFALAVIPGLLWIRQIGRRAASSLLFGAAVSMAAFLGITLLVEPESLRWWWEALRDPPTVAGVVDPKNWQTATLATWIRLAWERIFGDLPTWPMVIVPTCTFLITGLMYAFRRPVIEWHKTLSPVLCLSLLTSSYGWLFDQSVLMVCLIQLVCEAWGYRNRTHRILIVGGVVLIEAMAFAVGEFTEGAQHYFAWIPAAVLALWFVNEKLRVREAR